MSHITPIACIGPTCQRFELVVVSAYNPNFVPCQDFWYVLTCYKRVSLRFATDMTNAEIYKAKLTAARHAARREWEDAMHRRQDAQTDEDMQALRAALVREAGERGKGEDVDGVGDAGAADLTPHSSSRPAFQGRGELGNGLESDRPRASGAANDLLPEGSSTRSSGGKGQVGEHHC